MLLLKDNKIWKIGHHSANLHFLLFSLKSINVSVYINIQQ